MPFQLKSGTDQFDFEIDGSVSKVGNHVGKWTVTPDNKIKLTKDAGGETTFDVEWQVNNQNQLELLQNAATAFNFHNVPAVRPMYSTSNAVFSVQPDRNKTFKFALRGAWAFTPDFLLKFKVGNKESIFDGFLNDSDKSAFSYHFNNKAKTTQGFDLVFTGQWTHVANSLEVKFVYDKEQDAGGAKTGVFDLPKGLSLEPTVNQLFYQYSKSGQTHGIELSGRLIIGSDFRITYILDEQVTAGIRTTTFQIATDFHNNDTDGNLQLTFERQGQVEVVTVGGSFTHVFGAAELQIGFNYTQRRNGVITQSVIGFNGHLQAKDGNNAVAWTIQKSGKSFTLDVTSHVALGPNASVDSHLNIASDSTGVIGVTAMFGVHF